jgi:hypothetical protein
MRPDITGRILVIRRIDKVWINRREVARQDFGTDAVILLRIGKVGKYLGKGIRIRGVPVCDYAVKWTVCLLLHVILNHHQSIYRWFENAYITDFDLEGVRGQVLLRLLAPRIRRLVVQHRRRGQSILRPQRRLRQL